MNQYVENEIITVLSNIKYISLGADSDEKTITFYLKESADVKVTLPNPSRRVKKIILKIDTKSVEDFKISIDNIHMITAGIELSNIKSHACFELIGDTWALRSGTYININS